MESSKGNYEKLLELLDSHTQEELQNEFPQGTLNRNIRDVLAHLHHWHLLMLQWYTVGMSGKKPHMPAKGYTWKTTPDLNRKIWEEYKDMELGAIRNLLHQSHGQVQQIIESHTDEELFQKRRYPWTGSTSLGSYLVSNTTSHYDWALRLIKRQLKSK